MKPIGLIQSIVGAALVLAALGTTAIWNFCVAQVPHDRSLVLIRKTGKPLAPGQTIAEPGQKGIQRATLGPGLYLFNPWVWEWELHPLVEISAGDPASWREQYAEAAGDTASPQMEGAWPEVGIVVNKVGKPAPDGQEVVEAGYQGIQRDVLTPGVYRVNPYAFEVRKVPATVVPLGYCGVVTSQLGEMPGVQTVEEVSIGPDGQPIQGKPKVIQKLAEPGQRGVLKQVLQPGIYYLNPYVHRVQLVQVGYNQISQVAVRTRGAKGELLQIQLDPEAARRRTAQQTADAQERQTGEISTHITFPSKDGFTINVEVTVVWGRHPAHVAEMLNRFGDLAKLKEIILGQMRSICRNLGSEYDSTDFIRGEKRELYQQAVTETLRRVCRERDIDILIALIHNIEVHGSPEAEREGMDLKKTIQRGYIAREQDLTKQAQRESARVQAELETAKVAIDVAREQISAETRKKVAEIKAEGHKQAQETEARRDLEVATIERQIADIDADRTRVLGKASALVERLTRQAEADGMKMLVEALGTGRAYNLYTFAQSFEPEAIRLIFAGEGTFWTDLTRLQDAASMELLRRAQPAEKASEKPPAGPARKTGE
jgi:hypothetical protein